MAGAALLAVLSILVFPASPSSATGTLKMTGISPSSGPVAKVVTVTGAGFVADDVVAFNGTTATVSSVNLAGTKLTTSVPPLATTGVVTVADPTTGQRVELPNNPFTVTKGIAMNPSQVWAGQQVTFEGSGLSPDMTDAWGIGSTVLGHARVNGSGGFQLGASVPLDEQSGRVELFLVDAELGRVLGVLLVLGDWPQSRHDANHTGLDSLEPGLTTTTVPKLTLSWQANEDPAATFAMVASVADGMVFEGADETSGGQPYYAIIAYSANGSKVVWSRSGGWFGTVGPESAVANGVLYFPLEFEGLGTRVVALNALTGAQIFDVQVDYDPLVGSAITVSGNTLLVGEQDGDLHALNATTGAALWSYSIGTPVVSTPAVAGGVAYVGSNDGSLYAVNATTGKKVWSVALGGAVKSSPSVVGGVVYVGTATGSAYALKASTGAVVWHQSFSSSIINTSPAVAGGLVYFSDNQKNVGIVYALATSDGTEKWHSATGGNLSDPAVANGVLYFSSKADNQVGAFDASTGHELWQTNVVTAPIAPTVAGGRVYVEGQNSVWAFWVT